VQKLDDFANRVVREKMDHTGYLCAMLSEEDDEIIEIPDKHPQGGRYTLAFDPLDGSSNIDVNAAIGTIFSINRKVTTGLKGAADDFLQVGSTQICAGYIIYGSSTMLVYTAGAGVFGFTLDPSIGEFLMSHPNIKFPDRGTIESVNEGNRHKWSSNVCDLVDHFKGNDSSEGLPYKSRYIGSLVADFHRNLMKGGIFMYPAEKDNPGKLRMLYEASPIAFIAEQAGGAAINEKGERILDIKPKDLHERVSFYVGNRSDIKTCKNFLLGGN
ncbi:MAG: class 1 fructose-bisphosphatase, partial [Nitrospinota bacterium]